MKKLLSICFLSIFLMMFGMQAQAQMDCCFSLSNPAGDTIHDLVNVPGGDLPQNHTMNPLVWQNTDTYSLQFSDTSCLSITGDTKVSIELELWLDVNGNMENILDGQHNVSDYCNITLQTTYNELHWVGSPMIGSNYPYAFEYPGAVQIFEGTYNISNVKFDYFFYNFLMHGQTRLMIYWNQISRDAVLIAHVRERIHGTNHEFYWDEQQRLNVGGHQSHPMRILASDTISTDRYYEDTVAINDCEPVTVGLPPYTMDTSGTYKVAYLDTTGCNTKVDSIITYVYNHYVHPTTPTLHDSTYRYCQKGTAEPIVLPTEPNHDLDTLEVVPYWYFASLDSFMYAPSFTPVTDTAPGTYEYYVKRHDNLTGCESAVDTFHVTINPNPANPVVTNPIVEYCVGSTAVPLTYPAPTGMQVLWGKYSDIDSLSPTPITPSTAAAGQTIYYLRLQDTSTVNFCISEGYDSITVKVFDNPVVSITHDNDSLCYNDVVTLTANQMSFSTYAWSKNGVLLPNDTLYTLTDTNKTTVETFMKYSLAVTVKHDSVTCAANALDSIKVYPLIGTPTPVIPALADTSLCGPGHSLTMKVANGANATISRWYAANKTTILATDTVYTQVFNQTDTIYVSSLNAKGCETPQDQWLRRIITVDTLPVVTLSADNNAEVCAGMDLIIRSNPVEPTYTYLWRGDSLKGVLTNDSVIFNSSLAGTFHDTLRVTNKSGLGCFNDFDIVVTVDPLPVLVAGVDYTVKDNEFCVGANGKITFVTEYVKYSINDGTSWRNHPNHIFDTLPAATYNLKVVDTNGCVNKPANIVVLKDTLTYPDLTITDSANTRCLAPFNGKLMIAATPITGTYVYQLDGPPAQTDSVFAGLVDRNDYHITVTDTVTGCTTDSLNQVVTNGKVTPTPHLSSVNNTHCAIPYDGIVNVDSVSPITGAYHYKLASLIDTTPYQVATAFTGLHHGLYSVIVEDTVTACVGSDTVTVKYTGVLPTATVTGPDHICYPDTNSIFYTTITTPNVVFVNWDYIGSVPDSTINTFRTKDTIKLKNYNTGAAFPPGTHILISHILDTVTHCDNIIMDTVRVIAVNIDLLTDPATTVCEYDTVKVYCNYIKADPTDSIVSYTWFNGNHVEYAAPGVYDTALVIPTSSASYVSVIVEDNHRCSGAFGRTISVWNLPAITISSDTAYCKGTNHNLVVSLASTNTPLRVEWWQGTSMVHLDPSLTTPLISTYNKTVNNDTTLVIKAEDVHHCKNQKDYNLVAVVLPSDPYFDNNPDYFCTNDDIAITVRQHAPIGGDLVWNTTDPNVTKLPGSYTVHYEVTAQTSTCKSADSTVVVSVPGKPTFSIALKYNSEGSATTSKARCYDAAAGDTINMTVTTGAIGTMAYTYQLNSNATQTTTSFVITETEVGTYNDTIRINATQTYPDGTSCDWDTTVYYTLTVNPLPVAPDNFPNAYNGGDSTIFYCEGSTATYDFTTQSGFTYTYSSGSKPTTEGSYNLIVTNDVTGCVSTFPYKIVKVPTPIRIWSHTASAKNCGANLINDTIIATITNSIDASFTRFFVWNPGDSVAKTINADTLIHPFSYPNDTMVTFKIGVHAENGDYSATCYKTPTDTVKVTFQPNPTTPALHLTYPHRIDSTHVAYCYDDVHLTPVITADSFATSVGAHVTIVGYTQIDTAGVYKVVANNNSAPYCPSDTLYLTVIRNREIQPLDNMAGYLDGTVYKVYYCAGNTAVYDFGATTNPNDSVVYLNGTTVLTTAPDTVGSYTLRIIDKSSVVTPKCSKDFAFDIIKVTNPNFNITFTSEYSWNIWADTTMCQGSHYTGRFTSTETRVGTITPGATAQYVCNWPAFGTGHRSPSYSFDVTADSSIVYSYVGYDTAGNTGYGVACPFEYRDTIFINYLAAPAVPVYTGDTTFCDGDSIMVVTSNFTLATGTELVSTPALPYTFKASGNLVVYAQYPTYTYCKSTNNTINITKYNLPLVKITPAIDTICKGDTTVLKVTGADTYVWSTTSTIDSIFATDSIAYSVIGTDAHGCVNYDTARVKFHPVFTVEMSKDTTVCVGGTATIFALVDGGSGNFNFKWYQDDATTPFADADDNVAPYQNEQAVNPPTSPRVNGAYIPTHYSVLVTDNTFGCTSKAADNYVNVTAAPGPYMIFRQIDSTESIRHMHVDQGDQSGFEIYIYDKGACPADAGAKVFVDFQIYKNGVPMSDAELGEMMDDYMGSNNMLYDFDLSVGAGNISTLTIQSSTNSANGFFPDISNQEWMGGMTFYFDWFYMHFILGVQNSDGGHDGRKITVNTGMWKPGSSGVYTFSYAVIRAGAGAATNNGLCYEGTKLLGGYGSHSGLTVKDTIVADFFTIYVGDSVYTGTTNYNYNTDIANPTDVTTYPSVEEEKHVDMKVYPNPASNNVNVILEGISGQTSIMVYDMSGKVVSSMRVEVADNGQIVNLPVENYTQGIYFIKAVNGDAVMTKKLIIAR
jgi:hypothetical protein